MRWMRGSALFVAGTLVGFSFMQRLRHRKKSEWSHAQSFGLYVKDMDESTKFYTEKWGFRKAFRSRTAQATQLYIPN